MGPRAVVPSRAPLLSEPTPTTFVLVHGAWHGGWCWSRVVDRLRTGGHRVYAPTLTGLGERSHLAGADVTLETHVTDVVNVLRWEGLEDVVLCGHSYGGLVISGVAERAPERLRALVYLDAFVPDDGEAMLDLVAEPLRIRMLAAAGDGAIPPIPAERFRVNEADRAMVDRLCVPQPIGTFTEPVRVAGGRDRIPLRTYVRAAGYPSEPFDRARERCSAAGWPIFEIACGHDVMLDAPDALVDALLRSAEGPRGSSNP